MEAVAGPTIFSAKEEGQGCVPAVQAIDGEPLLQVT